MITVIQRVTTASVKVNNVVIGAIEQGIVALLGFDKQDTSSQIERLIERILNYRIFSDENDQMNLNVRDIGGGVLLVPQFTLVADTNRGNRPSFSCAAPPELAKEFFDYSVAHAKKKYVNIESGEFAANMQVNLCNSGPVTFILEKR